MPVAVYVFSVCTFAFGLSEFVAAGLISAMAASLGASIEAAGASIAVYALGAAIGAPLVTALLAPWTDRRILALAMAVLAAGSVLMSLSPTLPVLLGVRFLVGLAHGVFMAVASDAAARLVPAPRAGRALSVVWIGLTLALALGVPLGTFLGSIWSWRAIFAGVGALALAGVIGLLRFMPVRGPGKPQAGVRAGLKALAHPRMLATAGVGALVSVATFSFFTFISPYLLQVTRADVRWLSAAMLLFGLCSIAGNLLGGYLADAMDGDRAALYALAGLTVNLLGLYLSRGSGLAVVVLAGALGMVFFCIVTLLTLRLLKLAQRHVPESTAVAAGLNIASFNLGTAAGGGLGSLTIVHAGLAWLPLVGAVAAVAAMAALRLQRARTQARGIARQPRG
ncbi:major facilitator superfamily protein 30 [Achromobacter xylosoxidans A8]|uniref:Major facilitator superfamily protein 30 n=2 Tax=Alcaligenes xylosoxydans xylosoxydans TaxID=85698 RepID=E3HI29_ACHXA|nr:major facilitator superfamily protein 30 [Achromobacter xylosoxidans A8]